MKGRNFRSQNQAHMIYASLIFQGETQYFMLGKRYFGHLPVIRYLPKEDACRILSRGNCVFARLILLNTPAEQNVISSLGRKPLPKFFTQVPSHAVKIPIRFLRLSATHMNNLNHHHENIINFERNPRKLKP